MVLIVAAESAATSVSGGGVTTWAKAASAVATSGPIACDVWWGVVGATGSQTITVAGPSTVGLSLLAQEFSGPAGVWTVDVTASATDTTAGSGDVTVAAPTGTQTPEMGVGGFAQGTGAQVDNSNWALTKATSGGLMSVLSFTGTTGAMSTTNVSGTWAGALAIFYIQTIRTVTFNANGGSGTMAAESSPTPAALTANTYTRTGYTFTGWNTLPGGGGTAYADGATYSFSADATLYAQWAAGTESVAFNANGGSGTMSSETFTSGTPQALTTNTFTYSGYVFTGWNSAADGSGTGYADGQSISIVTALTLYAQWALPTFTVTFNANGGSGTMASQVASAGAALDLNTYTRAGYTFAGWNSVPNGTATAYANGAAFPFTSNATLYAQWAANGSIRNVVPGADFRVISAIAVLNPNGHPKEYLTDIMAGGSVTIDATAENIRTCSFQCLDPAGVLTPVDPDTGDLLPDGVEIQIFSGYIFGGETVLYSQGVFGVTEVDAASASNAPGPVLSVTGSDRSVRISRNLFADAYAIAAGAGIATAVLGILSQQATWCTHTSIVNTTATVAAQMYQPGDDPWQAIQEICASAGLLAYFDREGILRVIEDPSLHPAKPTALFIDGAAATHTSVTRITSNSPGYNGVIVTGQSLGSSSTVISGSAFDSDPSSPTYYLGVYGKVPAPPVQASTVSTNAAAAAMAHALLPQVLGLTRQVVVDTVPCFWLDAYDLIFVVNRATQTREVAILEQATIPLDFSQLEAITGVPLGSPISQFDGLSNAPSVAAYAPTSSGAFNYNPTTGTYTYGSTGSAGGIGFGGFGAGAFGLGVMYPNQGGIVRRVLSVGNGKWRIFRDAQGVETVTDE